MSETLIKRHGGFSVAFDPRRFTFRIDDDNWPDERDFKSYEDATKAIDKNAAEEAKLVKANATLNLRLMTEEGSGVTITSINRATGMVSGPDYRVPKSTSMYSSKKLYPDLMWVKLALLKERQLYQEWQAIKEQLREIEVDTKRGGYGTISAAHFQHYLTKLEEEAKAAYAKAEALPTKTEEQAA